jgi:hypothetical protein
MAADPLSVIAHFAVDGADHGNDDWMRGSRGQNLYQRIGARSERKRRRWPVSSARDLRNEMNRHQVCYGDVEDDPDRRPHTAVTQLCGRSGCKWGAGLGFWANSAAGLNGELGQSWGIRPNTSFSLFFLFSISIPIHFNYFKFKWVTNSNIDATTRKVQHVTKHIHTIIMQIFLIWNAHTYSILVLIAHSKK